MKNRKKRTCEILTMAFAMTMSSFLPAFGASWQQDSAGWRWQKDDGSYHTGGWQWLDGNQDGVSECYYFDVNGYMLSNTTTPDGYQVNGSGAWVENGVVKTMGTAADPGVSVQAGRWLKGAGANVDRWWWQNADGSYPAGVWQWLDGNQDGVAECYYFDQNGWVITSGQTPDGYQVDADGRWLENQVVKTRKVQRGNAGPGTGYVSGSGTAVFGGVSGGGGSSSGGGGGSSSGGGSHGSTSSGIIADEDWSNYSDDTSGCANDFKNGNFGMMSSAQWKKTKEAIEKFQRDYLTDGMSDFEKEIRIIEWLVENCSYERGEDWSRSTAYSCIVLGRAQCSGYADAFLQTAKLCGLDVRYIYNSTHAWNLIKLDGDWYHVDVTWEDPVGSNNYGFGNLRNSYINLEDDKIRNIAAHKFWSPSSVAAKGTKYGPKVVEKYLDEGIIDTSIGTSFEEDTEKFYASVAEKEDSLVLQYTSVNDAVNKIVAYLSSRIDCRDDTYTVLLRFGNAFRTTDKYGYRNAGAAKKNIVDAVNEKLFTKYGAELQHDKSYQDFYLSLKNGSGEEYYSYWSGRFYYNKGYDIQLPYTIHYVCDGTEISSQSGTAETGASVELEIPEGYKFLYSGSGILKGKGSVGATKLILGGREAVEAKVALADTSMVSYKITYKDELGNTLDTVTGTGRIGSTITPGNKSFEGYELVSENKTYTLSSRSQANSFVVRYRKNTSSVPDEEQPVKTEEDTAKKQEEKKNTEVSDDREPLENTVEQPEDETEKEQEEKQENEAEEEDLAEETGQEEENDEELTDKVTETVEED